MISSMDGFAVAPGFRRWSKLFVRTILLLAVALPIWLLAAPKAQAECQTSQDCFNEATWQRAIADQYQNEGNFFRGYAQHYFAQAYEWGQKATFAFHAGDATAATWYKAIADDYSRKSVQNANAADEKFRQAHFVRVAAQGTQGRGSWLQTCEANTSCTRFHRPSGFTDAEWFIWVGTYGDHEEAAIHPAAVNICPDNIYCPAIAGNGPCKTITNTRQKKERIDPREPQKAVVLQITLTTEWCFKNGLVTKMFPGDGHCDVTAFGHGRGWHCDNPNGHKLRAHCTGGNPEHCHWIYSFDIHRAIWVPVIGEIVTVETDRWCAGNQVSGSGAHKRTGRCINIEPW